MIRAAREDDYAAVVALHAELGVDDPTPSREQWIARLMPDTLVCERASALVGFVHFVTFAAVGHVRQLAVAPTARRAGIGRALMLAAAAAYRERGVRDWQLNVKEHNEPAIRLYESLGFAMAYRSVVLRIAWRAVDALAADAAALTARSIEPSEDAGIERAFGIVAGRLSQGRARPGRVLVQLRDARDTPVAIAVFDPDFPGAFPFKAVRPTLARNLLDALRAYALPQFDYVGTVIEADEALVEYLIAGGAEVRFRILAYRGGVP